MPRMWKIPALRSCARLGAPALALLLAVAGCGEDEAGPSPDEGMTAAFTGLPPSSPSPGHHFELWVSFARPRLPGLRHSDAASAGAFRIDASGRPVDLNGSPVEFAVDPEDPRAEARDGAVLWQLALDCFVTVEPDGEDDGEPLLPGLLAGSFLNGACDLDVDEPDAIDVDFSSAAGTVHLATPTTTSGADEAEGLWFAALGGAAGSLLLPTLTAGTLWTYEAWVQHPVAGLASLGKFRNPGIADLDGAGPLGGTGYPFPGSDFPFGAAGTDLSGATVFVTLEPPLDADAEPFFLRVLSAPVGGAAPGIAVTLTAFPTPLPTAHVTIPFAP